MLQPPPQRLSITPPTVDRSWKQIFSGRSVFEKASKPAKRPPGWKQVVSYRQRVTLVLTLLSTGGILYFSYLMLRSQQMPDLAMHLYLVIYGLMIFFLSSSFFKMMLGTWHALRGPAGNRWHPAHSACDPKPSTRVAIVFPVYHEDVARLAAGVAATWESLSGKHADAAKLFDLFILSDSRKVDFAISEEAAVHQLRRAFPMGRFFYRRRVTNRHAKLGNIADFCRRWGKCYDYMLVMDADSVMDGDAIVALLRMMEGNPRIGILQTNPTPILRTSLFGRMQQFAARLYGSVFSYSLQSMYMGNASYIGHNAMIRLEPFISHCVLPTLPGRAPWGGKPLSHDIIESAMIARAGYEVWFLPEIQGSYEELPANMLAYLIRERRWMQGNMQHLRFLFVAGLQSIHRETFITGSMGYVAAPLWAFFLLLSAFGMFHFLENGLLALGGVRMLEMPMTMLFLSSMVFLFTPRLLSFAIHIGSDNARRFGGKDKLAWSLLFETMFSLVFSPVQMIVLSRFIWLWIKRKTISWDTQARGDGPLPWRVCLRHFGWVTVLGFAGLGIIVYRVQQVPAVGAALLVAVSDGWLRPSNLVLWLFPILIGFTASAVIVRVTSCSFPSIRTHRLFAIPEEIEPPEVVSRIGQWTSQFQRLLPESASGRALAYALCDRRFYVWHRSNTRLRPHIARGLLPKIRDGIALTEREMLFALDERRCFDALHLGCQVQGPMQYAAWSRKPL